MSKEAALKINIGGTPVHVGGMCKGSGMIHPNMATMLGVVTCDADVAPGVWRDMLKRATDASFNAVRLTWWSEQHMQVYDQSCYFWFLKGIQCSAVLTVLMQLTGTLCSINCECMTQTGRNTVQTAALHVMVCWLSVVPKPGLHVFTIKLLIV